MAAANKPKPPEVTPPLEPEQLTSSASEQPDANAPETQIAAAPDSPPAPPPEPEASPRIPLTGGYIVRAVTSFGDTAPQRSYRAGDVVPWTRERAAHYPHLVTIEEA